MTIEDLYCVRIFVRGIVQGVGFRPFVYQEAVKNALTGWVRNTSSGVEIEIYGKRANVEEFLHALKNHPPPLARLDQIEVSEISPNGMKEFLILESKDTESQFLPVSPDISICEDCLRELFDPENRRYRYPFINCTNCGPRFTIIKGIPYDRPNTTMASFALCPECHREYTNPLDRRFHAQPIACPECGPHLWLEINGQPVAEKEEALQKARQLLKEGAILAIKGLGGFHLACDAANETAVKTLRNRKKRSDKPFAVMVFDLSKVEKIAEFDEEEKALLLSRQKPIVLLRKKVDAPIVPEVSPDVNTVGVMLPYTPLHYLLLEPEENFPEVLVMTSGNLSEEPIAYEDKEAQERLLPIADAFLMHNRAIYMRVDDSVMSVSVNSVIPIRRARGYAPDSISLPFVIPPVLATGAELKNTFCLTRDQYAFLSHHIGDMENLETFNSFVEGIEHFQKIFRIHPQVLACDLHPDYMATRYAEARAEQEGLPLIRIQHHHAHLASCLVEHQWNTEEPVIGLIFDGTGLGDDRAIWGGEILVGGYGGYLRRFHLEYIPLPGGDAAIRNPARTALAHLWQAGIPWEEHLPPCTALCRDELSLLHSQLKHHINTPWTSSMGRLFDAVASLIGLRQEANYEAQAAIALEVVCDTRETETYPIILQENEIKLGELWHEIMKDWGTGMQPSIISAKFHNWVTAVALSASKVIRTETGLNTVVCSGGVWQNRVLVQKTKALFEQNGFKVLFHKVVPPNDGGLSLGQAAIAGWKALKRD